ncbi:hypothetical protein Tco_0823871 [Tanacetum coccineum]|uniref:Uncharacterized protein n=1 Tax=Tanacetum coccineum TaxID=301880 RepID=A0ABQ5ALU0_9ASTR
MLGMHHHLFLPNRLRELHITLVFHHEFHSHILFHRDRAPRGCHVVTRGCQVNKWVPPADVDATWTTTWLAADQSEAASWHSYPCRLADLDVRGSELMIGVKWLSLRFSLRSNH